MKLMSPKVYMLGLVPTTECVNLCVSVCTCAYVCVCVCVRDSTYVYVFEFKCK